MEMIPDYVNRMRREQREYEHQSDMERIYKQRKRREALARENPALAHILEKWREVLEAL